MGDYLILKLYGPMQAWGEHTFEGYRPSANLPSRSALLGLLGACLGIKRNDRERQQQLAQSICFAVCKEDRFLIRHSGKKYALQTVKLVDYHTVKEARKDYTGLKTHETIQTWREYLFDAFYTVAVWNIEPAFISLNELEQAVKKPLFTPYLGRRCCPLSRPLFETRVVAENAQTALWSMTSDSGTIYSEEQGAVRTIRMRDVPLVNQPRQFASRNVYIYGGRNAFEQSND